MAHTHDPKRSCSAPKEWHHRGYLPHFDASGLIQGLTFRLHDAVPAAVVRAWREQLNIPRGAPADDPGVIELRLRIERYADAGRGACWLQQPRIGQMVERAVLHFDGERYRLLAWVVMPNHLHLLVETTPGHPVKELVQTWKSYSASQANRMLQRKGPFWQADYFDRFIRNERHYAAALRYIEQNPVKAGLVESAEKWPLGSARLASGEWF